jgi:hypothetical protein
MAHLNLAQQGIVTLALYPLSLQYRRTHQHRVEKCGNLRCAPFHDPQRP